MAINSNNVTKTPDSFLVDGLSALLTRLKLGARVFLRADFCGDWAVDTSGERRAPFHLVTRGTGWLHAPGAEPIDAAENTDPLVLSVDSEGSLYLNVGEDESSPIDAARVIRMTSVVLERQPNTPVLVKADFRVPYGDVVAAMVLLQRAGAQKVGFLTDPADFEKLEAG